MNMYQLFKVGDIIKGYCNGYFGRDDYNNKTCIMVSKLYAVFEYDDGYAVVLNYDDELMEYAKDWK